jgi:hypothetical protein
MIVSLQTPKQTAGGDSESADVTGGGNDDIAVVGRTSSTGI